jgi:signal transduction histidine kinase
VPIIVNTGYARSYSITDVAQRIDLFGYVVKSDFDPGNEVLVASVRSAVKYRRALAAMSELDEIDRPAGNSNSEWRPETVGSVFSSGQIGRRSLFERIRFVLMEAAGVLDEEDLSSSIQLVMNTLSRGQFSSISGTSIANYLLALLKQGAQLPPAEIDLRRLLSDIASRHRQIQQRSGVGFDLDGDSGVQAKCPKDTLEAVVDGLFSNSRAAVRAVDSPEISVRLRRTITAGPAWVTLEISDNGVGMAPELLDNLGRTPLWLPGKPKVVGGCGWIAMRLLLAVSGGSIAVSSVVGQGTRVRIVLPAAGQV